MAARAPFTAAELSGITALVQDLNGTHVYSNNRALFGYLDARYYLIITPAILQALATFHTTPNAASFTTAAMGANMGYAKLKASIGEDYEDEKDYLAYGSTADEELELHKMTALNYGALRTAGLNATDAYAVAGLRARWVSLGCLFSSSGTAYEDTHAAFTEVVVQTAIATPQATRTAREVFIDAVLNATNLATIGAAFATKEEALEYLRAMKDADTGNAFIVAYAEAIWAITEYLFRTRGHHFKTEYIALINKMFSAAFEGNPVFPTRLTASHIFHTAIHPFGIRMLPVMTFHFALLAKLGAAILYRLDAAPNGTAVITTTAAALTTLKTEPWYKAFYNAMSEQINMVLKMAEAILANKYAFHMSASLYGATKVSSITVASKEYTIEAAKSEAAPVATVVQGFINYLEGQVEAGVIKDYTLRNAKSLAKHAAGNPSLAIKVSVLCDIVNEAMSNIKEVTAAAAIIFPAIRAMNVQAEALPASTSTAIVQA